LFGSSPKAAGLPEYGGSYAGAYLLRRGLYMPWELGAVLDRETIVEGSRRLAPLRLIDAELFPKPQNAFARVAVLESAFYMRNQLLRDTDWASMAHSLEVRTPLVDRALLTRMGGVEAGRIRGKRELALAPSRPLSRKAALRPKTGFSTPIGTWMQSLTGDTRNRKVSRRDSRTPWPREWSRIAMAALRD
jgi:asparagine synthase (glutamine-hydrolysing)